MQIKITPGTEKYIKLAKQKLQTLRRLRKDLKLPSMNKYFKPDADTMIRVKSTEWEEYIYIDGGGLNFLVAPVIRTPGSVTYNGLTRFLIPKTLDQVQDWVNASTEYSVGTKSYISGEKLLLPIFIAGVNGYASGKKIVFGQDGLASTLTSYGGILYTVSNTGRVFKFSTGEEVTGSIATWQASTADYAISGKVVVYTNASSAPPSAFPYLVNALTFSGTEDTGITVTYGTQENLSPFGAERTIADNDIVVTGDNTSGTAFATQDESINISHDVVYPVCIALNSDGTRRQIGVRSVRAYQETLAHDESDSLPGNFITYSDTYTKETAWDVTLQSVAGPTLVVPIERISVAHSGSGAGETTHTTSGSGTYAAHNTLNYFETLFGSAAWDTLIYKLTGTDEVITTTGSHITAFSVQADVTDAVTDSLKVYAFIDGVQKIVYEVENVRAPVTTIALAAGYSGYSASFSAHTDTLSNLEPNPYYWPEQSCLPTAQFGRLPTGEYLGSVPVAFLTFEHAVFASKEDLSVLKLAVVNRVLQEHAQDPVEDATGYDWGFTEIRVV